MHSSRRLQPVAGVQAPRTCDRPSRRDLITDRCADARHLLASLQTGEKGAGWAVSSISASKEHLAEKSGKMANRQSAICALTAVTVCSLVICVSEVGIRSSDSGEVCRTRVLRC